MIEVKFNPMVRWSLRKMGESILTYNRYAEEAEDIAGILFKADWLRLDFSIENGYSIPSEFLVEDPVRRMEELLDEHEGSGFEEGKEEYEKFVEKFKVLYVALEGSDGFNRSLARKAWGHTAMKKRLTDLRKYNLTYDLIYQNGICKLVKNTEQAE